MTTNDKATRAVDNFKARLDPKYYRESHYRGYTLIYQPMIGDCHIFDALTGELIDCTGMGTSGAKIYIDQWHDAK